jgi:hypothetical protein
MGSADGERRADRLGRQARARGAFGYS